MPKLHEARYTVPADHIEAAFESYMEHFPEAVTGEERTGEYIEETSGA